LQKRIVMSYSTGNSKPVKQEVNSTVILPPLVFRDKTVTAVTTAIVDKTATTAITTMEQSGLSSQD